MRVAYAVSSIGYRLQSLDWLVEVRRMSQPLDPKEEQLVTGWLRSRLPLWTLAALLCELAFGRRLYDLIPEPKHDELGSGMAFRWFIYLHQVVPRLIDETGPDYANAVSKCIRSDPEQLLEALKLVTETMSYDLRYLEGYQNA